MRHVNAAEGGPTGASPASETLGQAAEGAVHDNGQKTGVVPKAEKQPKASMLPIAEFNVSVFSGIDCGMRHHG